MSLTTIGIDPGKTGAAALLIDGIYEDVIDWSDGPGVADKFHTWFLIYEIHLVVLEKVHAMPKQGVTSSFSFGQNYGWWQGYLDGRELPWREARPQTWMKEFNLVGKRVDKNAGLICARRLFPTAPLNLVKHSGRADALLMASWAFKQLNLRGEKR